ncbi:MAG: S-methyl-5'-thioadenosine phosphorylase [Planctomycetota bacterium]|nr:MAG: S-methyl-5'-thioadenosine phosphorylase [Planctomycetota bacterium]
MTDHALLGVIGGSGVYDIAGLRHARSVTLSTPYGDPSAPFLLGEYEGVPLAFVPRHGNGHRLLPTEVPYRANVYALRQLGCQRVLSISAVGSLQDPCAPGHFVLVDQFIDRTVRRVSTFFGDGIVAHVPMAEPVDAGMRRAVLEAGHGLPITLHDGGTYLCIEGPQFSTRAESELYRSWGCRVIGMTNATEARLAREAGMSFCTVAMVTDYDCWHPEHDSVTVEQVVATAMANAERVRELVRRSVPRIAALGPSPWRNVLRGAVMTAPDGIPAAARQRTAALFARD